MTRPRKVRPIATQSRKHPFRSSWKPMPLADLPAFQYVTFSMPIVLDETATITEDAYRWLADKAVR